MATDAQIAVGIVTRRRCPCCRAYWSWCTCNETQMEAAWERFADEHGLAEPFRRATQTGGPT